MTHYIIVTGMVLMSLVLYNKFYETAKINSAISTSQIMDQVNINLGYYIDGMSEVSNLVNDELNNDMITTGNNIDNLLEMALKLRKDIVTLAVFSKNGDLVASSSGLKLKKGLNVQQEEWFKEEKLNPESLHYSYPHVENLFTGKHLWVVSLSRETNINYNYKSVIKNDIVEKGVLLVNLNFSAIDELCHNVSLGKRGYMYIIDKYGNIIYHPQQQMIYAGLKKENIDFAVKRQEGNYIEDYNGEQTVVSIKNVKYTQWKLVGVSYNNDMITTQNDIYSYFVLILIVSIFIICGISILISARISMPIKKLEKIMRKVEQGELNIYADVEGEKEVRQLSKTFNLMIYKIRQLMEQIIEEQEEKRKSELKALQAQINPHFLYNTLDSIVWMAENDENDGVVQMVTALANFFRISISRGGDIIDIREELQHAKSYLIIQQIRYGDKFDFIIEEMPPSLIDHKTLKIILQPIIENAIYHGIKGMVDKGYIRISGQVIGDKICLCVTDNGLGMSMDKVSKILLKKEKKEKGSGIGVKNVHERIQLYYGREYGLEISSEVDEGTTVKIWIPLTGEQEGE
ncbi:cache domain-containing sensor histidine kinase [Clostridium lacusfryxellense]|uniref:cache domain-containing sensor histidine kinase n=1 Tax=Clostridium lacusfryxellense TaxID=205328 RepID=UPI001C0CD2B5|nr:sensor histidine kinase [Clostridium lacusfryxellense]MBU3114839.1 sensor histidine kinase [Clostridium lacusfryxellense]